MISARWHCHARFGMKQDVIDRMKHWWSTIGKEIGQTDYTIATASVGAPEALVTVDVRVRDLSELDEQWKRLAARQDHKALGGELEPLIVSGSTRWEIFRAVE
jgi:hypothetical protein